MKKLLLLALAANILQLANAQIKEGKIVYEQKIDLHRRMQDVQMKAMVPQFRTTKYELYFGEAQSFYKMPLKGLENVFDSANAVSIFNPP